MSIGKWWRKRVRRFMNLPPEEVKVPLPVETDVRVRRPIIENRAYSDPVTDMVTMGIIMSSASDGGSSSSCDSDSSSCGSSD